MQKVIIEVRCNEYAMRSRNPRVPWSPEEIAADAAACREAGAAILHYHARDPRTGAPSHQTSLYAETIRRVRMRTDFLVMPTLGGPTMQDPLQRAAHIPELAGDEATRPDLAPLDLASSNMAVYQAGRGFTSEEAVYVNPVRALRAQLRTIRAAGVAVDAVLWDVGSARLLGAFLEEGELEPPQLVEIVLSNALLACHPESEAGLDAILAFLPRIERLPWLVLCAGGNALSLVEAVVRRGGHLALGLGDYPHPELGEPSNAEVVAEAVRRVRRAGAEPATPDEVRDLLDLP